MPTCTHWLTSRILIYLADAFWLFPWMILLQEINVVPWMIYFIFCHPKNQNKVDILRKQKVLYNSKAFTLKLKKNCVYLELGFCWKTNTIDPQQKKRSPLLTHSLIDWWCCLGRAASEMRIREQMGQVLFNKIPFKKEIIKFKELHLNLVKPSRINSFFEK
jgi:hypothetical protein